jgi:cytochrome c oxidase subunit 3
MVVFLAAWAMMFASLFFAYGFVRAGAEAWPPAGLPRLPWRLPLANTFVLVGSSVALQAGLVAVRRGRTERVGPALWATLLLGAAFLALQTYLWLATSGQGLRPETGGAYASVFFGLTWLHAAHVAVGLVGLTVVAKRALSGDYNPARHLPLRLWAWYWHFVGAVWAVMFVTVFLL